MFLLWRRLISTHESRDEFVLQPFSQQHFVYQDLMLPNDMDSSSELLLNGW